MVVLRDVLKPNLKVVFCGTAAADRSAQIGAYYAGRGNKFWSILHEIKLTPRQLEPHEFSLLPDYGIGLTDLAKFRHGADALLRASDFDRDRFSAKIEKYAPKVFAFNGKKAAQEFYGRRVNYGRQPDRLGSTGVFVLPSTSGSACRYWEKSCWQQLAKFVKTQ